MSLDELVLSAQRAIDRAVRRARHGAAPKRGQPKFLIVQIDGLARDVLGEALARGHMPFLRRLLHDGYRMEPMSVGLPTSTGAFQMAAFYGVRPDIPGFHYYSRERGGDIHFPRAGHAAWVEARQAAGRRGIIHGGSAYGCCFTGGATRNLFTFTSLPSGRGLASALSPFVIVAWVTAKSLGSTVKEVLQELARWLRDPQRGARGWRWLRVKVAMSIWVRNFFTLAVARDVYEGVPAIYVTYLDYDEMAHAFGPRSERALDALRETDRSLSQIWTVMRRVPEHRYDAYVLSDHGQSACTPYDELTQGRRIERWIFDAFLDPKRSSEPDAPLGGADREAYEQDGLRAIAAGPNAFLYVKDANEPLTDDAIERRFPGLAEKISSSPGVGFVLARAADGAAPVCWWRGRRVQLTPEQPGPFRGRDDAAVVVEGIVNLMRMPSAGDLVIYGTDAPEGHVSFIHGERGTHAGPGGQRTTHLHRAARRRGPARGHTRSRAAVRALHPLSALKVASG
jgi:hypothetical protein